MVQFSIECRKTKTKAITLANHKLQTIQWTNVYVVDAERGKTCWGKFDWFWFYFWLGDKVARDFVSRFECGYEKLKQIQITFDTKWRPVYMTD